MEKYNCIIVEDEPLARKGLEEYIAQIQFIDLIATFKNALEAIPFLNQHQVDLIFLDINMPKITGIQLMQSLQTVPMVIFTTAYTEYAVQGYELNAIDYLVKPIPLDRFLKACTKALEYQQFLKFNSKNTPSTSKDHFFIKADGKIIKIDIDELLYVEGLKDYVKIYERNKRYITYMTMKSIEDLLPSSRFLRVHRSFIVAIDKVEEIKGNEIIIKDHSIPIAKSTKEEVVARIVGDDLWKR